MHIHKQTHISYEFEGEYGKGCREVRRGKNNVIIFKFLIKKESQSYMMVDDFCQFLICLGEEIWVWKHGNI